MPGAMRFRGVVLGGLTCALALSSLSGPAGSSSPQTRSELAQAKKSLLVLGDMPKTWTASASSGGNAPTPAAAQLARCLGVPLKEVNDNPPTVSSKDFNGPGDVQSVQDSIEVFPTAHGGPG